MDKMIIDVREPSEFAEGHVEGAVNIPLQELSNGTERLAGLSKQAELVLYCRSGGRSQAALNILVNQGYTNVKNGINKEQVEADYI